MIPNQWGLNENGEMNLFCLLWYRWKKLYGPFLLMGFKGLKAAEPLQGDDLLFIIKSSGVPGTNLINLRWMKSWVSFGANQWFWTWDLCALKGGWTIWMRVGLWMMRDNGYKWGRWWGVDTKVQRGESRFKNEGVLYPLPTTWQPKHLNISVHHRLRTFCLTDVNDNSLGNDWSNWIYLIKSIWYVFEENVSQTMNV